MVSVAAWPVEINTASTTAGPQTPTELRAAVQATWPQAGPSVAAQSLGIHLGSGGSTDHVHPQEPRASKVRMAAWTMDPSMSSSCSIDQDTNMATTNYGGLPRRPIPENEPFVDIPVVVQSSGDRMTGQCVQGHSLHQLHAAAQYPASPTLHPQPSTPVQH